MIPNVWFRATAKFLDRYDAQFDEKTQKAILEDVCRFVRPEREAKIRESFASGFRRYGDRQKVVNGLVDDGRIIDKKDIDPDDDFREVETWPGKPALAFKEEGDEDLGWNFITPEAYPIVRELVLDDD